MSSHPDPNEGMRILDEFVCQAIPDPSVLADSSQPAPPATEHQLDLLVTDPASLSAILVGEDGRLRDRIEIDSGVALSPRFTSLPGPGAAGGEEVLAFVIHTPAGVTTHGVATAVYEWAARHGVPRMRVNSAEVSVSVPPAEAVPAIVQALGQKATGVQPDRPR
jgi:hypothetical protein